jgi:hypothetical protein
MVSAQLQTGVGPEGLDPVGHPGAFPLTLLPHQVVLERPALA